MLLRDTGQSISQTQPVKIPYIMTGAEIIYRLKVSIAGLCKPGQKQKVGINTMTDTRLTAEEFRDAVMDEHVKHEGPDGSGMEFGYSVHMLCAKEQGFRNELAALDLDCDSCKL